MHPRVVQHHDGRLLDGKRQPLELFNDELTRDSLARRLEQQAVVSHQQGEAVQAHHSNLRLREILSGDPQTQPKPTEVFLTGRSITYAKAPHFIPSNFNMA
jgi:hypothetical protein